MASTVTTNTYVKPQDGWIQLAPTAATFIRVSGYPHTHPYQLYFGSTAPSRYPTNATGSVVFSGLPTAGQAVTIGTEVFTFRASATLPFEVTIGADATATGANLVTALTADSTLVTGVNTTGTVALTAKTPGPDGNMTVSDNAANTASTSLTGGVDAVQGVAICHKPFWINVLTSQPLWVRVPNPVAGSRYNLGALRLDTIYST